MAEKKKEKPSELRSRWDKIRRYRSLAYMFLAFIIIDAAIFGGYGSLNPIGWLYGLVFLAFLFLSAIYIGSAK